MTCTLCDHCTAVCCQYLALPLDKPETRRDFDDIRWYLMHEGVTVFVEDGDWFVQIRARCRNLQADFKCGVYQTRPTICREYKAEDCDYVGGDYQYEHLFTAPEQIESYGKEILARQRTAPSKRRLAGKSKKRSKRQDRAMVG